MIKIPNQKKLIALGVLSLTFIFGYYLGQQDFRAALSGGRITFTNQNPPDQTVDFSLFWDVYENVLEDYYDKSKIDGTKVLYGAIQGMIGALGDPYSAFLNPEQNKQSKDDLSGFYEGVGIQLGFKEGKMVVIAPLGGTPAKEAGVTSGELILKIGDKGTTGMTLPEAVVLIRGSAGTTIELTLQRGNEEPRVVRLTRARIQVKSVEFKDLGGGIGLVKLSRFADNTTSEWTELVNQIAGKYQGLILDLRDNPGGYLPASIYVSSEFLSGGVVVKQEVGGKVTDFTVSHTGKLLDVPLVVLINASSASASEIVAGALMDRGRATLVGEKSFGKGTIQEVQDLNCPQGTTEACASLHLTTAKWLTPKGTWVDGVGLSPHVEVKLTEEDFKAGRDPQLDRAVEIVKGEI